MRLHSSLTPRTRARTVHTHLGDLHHAAPLMLANCLRCLRFLLLRRGGDGPHPLGWTRCVLARRLNGMQEATGNARSR